MKIRLLIVCFYFVFCHLYPQEHYSFSQINSSSGLSENRIRFINQLPDGRIVVVTEGMVNLYDGSYFHNIHFNEEFAYSLENYRGYHQIYINNENHLWLKNRYMLVLFDIARESFEPDIKKILEKYGIKEKIIDLFMDSEQNLWFLTQNDNLIYRNMKEQKSTLFLSNVSKLGPNKDLLYDVAVIEKEVFLCYKSGLMVCYDIETHEEKYRDNPLITMKLQFYVNNLRVVPYKQYLYQERNGFGKGIVLRFDTKNKKWELILQPDYWFNILTIDSSGNCLVSSMKGIWHINENLTSKNHITKFQLEDGRIIETEISTQYTDDKGGLWLGTLNRGLLYYHPDRFKFNKIGTKRFQQLDNPDLKILSLAEKDGKVFVGTSNGLFLYSKNTELLTKYNGIPENAVCTWLFKDSKNRIWICSEYNIFSIENGNIRQYSMPFINLYIHETYDGQFFICSNWGLYFFDPQSGNFERVEKSKKLFNNFMLTAIDFGNDSLIGIMDTGLFTYDRKNDVLSIIGKNDRDKPYMFRHSNHQYNCLYIDSRKLIWFGTQDGLNVWNKKTRQLRTFFKEDGLVNNSIQSIIEDNQQRIWISTCNGISCIIITENNGVYQYSFINYNKNDGIIDNEFLPRSVCQTSDSRLLWGGIDGMNEIEPDKLNSSIPPLSIPLFVRFFLFGKEIKQGEVHSGDIILQRSVAFTKKIELKYFQNFIGVEFSAFNYINPPQTYYRYWLEGIDNSWHELTSADGMGRADYTNLSPGTYKLKVCAANNSRKWSDQYAEIDIVIHPPFWKTSLAYIFYILILFSIFFLSVSSYIKTKSKKLERDQKEKLNQMKLSFFTNISHELRTPITLILTPLDAIIKKTKNVQIRKRLTGIYRNANDLLGLVNQLLDFRKIELKGEILLLNYCNIGEFLSIIASHFEELFTEKKIKFTYRCEIENLYAYVDKDKLHKIINNLLSNAYKFTSKGGSVTLLLESKSISEKGLSFFTIKVSDTGCGIPENELLKIFECYHQINYQNGQNTGSGIGLYLVKEYVRLHCGEIEVESILNKGSVFTIILPANLHPNDERQETIKFTSNKHAFRILVVEDNDEFRAFLSNELSENYSVIEASNGKEGLEKVKELHPDLVISDLMMPELTGLELCQKMRSDLQISHIPIIILTAKTSEKAQMEGFEVGADAYITKPFNLDILLLRIHNLMERQEQRRNLFKNAIVINPEELASTNVDQEFIKKAVSYIEKNINNPSYLVEELSNDMCMDRTGLYRKLIAISGQPPTSFIRSIRLKKAAQLLQQGQNITEVADNVGYRSTSYFSRCFREEFGFMPSHYNKSEKL